MKHKILMILLFFICMAAVPLGFIVKYGQTSSAKEPAPSPSAAVSKEETGALNALSLCRENFDDETIKAVCILQRTNIRAGDTEVKTADYPSETELYKRVKAIYNANKEILCYQNQTVTLPCSPCSGGFTEAAEEMPYLSAVASPWDCKSDLYDAEIHCRGVSISGVQYLCSQGLSAEEALLWYLPGFHIEASPQ